MTDYTTKTQAEKDARERQLRAAIQRGEEKMRLAKTPTDYLFLGVQLAQLQNELIELLNGKVQP